MDETKTLAEIDGAKVFLPGGTNFELVEKTAQGHGFKAVVHDDNLIGDHLLIWREDETGEELPFGTTELANLLLTGGFGFTGVLLFTQHATRAERELEALGVRQTESHSNY